MRNRMYRKPDLIAILAVLVGLGVLLTTGVQAGEAADPEDVTELAPTAPLALPETTKRMRFKWVRERLSDASIKELVTGTGLNLNRPSRARDGVLRLRWRAPRSFRSADRQARDLGASVSGPRVPRTGLFVTFDKRW